MLHGRRLRPSLARRLRRRMRAHRQGGAPSGQVDMDARRGHRPGHVPAAILPVPGGCDRCIGQSDGLEALRRRRRRIHLLITGIKIPYYGVPNQAIERRGVSHGIKLKHWRAVGHVFNTFAIESFVDQMAVDQGMDPIEFRFERMGATPKARKVFEALAQMSDYKAKRPDGRALGISITERSGSLGAGAVEISLDRASGKIRVHKVWVAVDGGVIVQPAAAQANVESGILYGLSSVLYE